MFSAHLILPVARIGCIRNVTLACRFVRDNTLYRPDAAVTRHASDAQRFFHVTARQPSFCYATLLLLLHMLDVTIRYAQRCHDRARVAADALLYAATEARKSARRACAYASSVRDRECEV